MTSRKLFLFCLFVVYGCDNSNARRCDSCMTIPECPEAVNFAMKEKDNLNYLKSIMKNAKCEGVSFSRGRPSPKICCEDFTNLIIISRLNDNDNKDNVKLHEEINKTKREENVNIETHENFELLPTKCGRSNGVRIFGGDLANLYELPWMVLISAKIKGKNKFHCGGSIINEKYVLTAAHCLQGHKIVGVRIGEYNINTKEDCSGDGSFRVCENHIQDTRVDEIIIHEDFTYDPPANDIALIRVKKQMDLSHKNTEPICLPVFNELIKMDLAGKRATVSGWGVTEFKRLSPLLRKVEIPIKTSYECIQSYPSYNFDETDMKVMCAGEEGKDSCSGDSGGPLVIEDVYNGTFRNIQFGLVSLGPKACGSGEPGLYTDVRKYVKWILDNIRE